jgi:hypothetical protein
MNVEMPSAKPLKVPCLALEARRVLVSSCVLDRAADVH